MIYQAGDPYGRSPAPNPLALRAMVVTFRERLLGLMCIPEEPSPPAGHSPFRRSLPAVSGASLRRLSAELGGSPEPAYVAAGNTPLRTPWLSFKSLLDARCRRRTSTAKRCPRSGAVSPTPSVGSYSLAAC